MEKVANKVKEMAKDVERAAKSMMYNLEQKIQMHLREKRTAFKKGQRSMGLPSAADLSFYASQSA
jgi:hypothetical protein